ncbi:MAG: response regulator, partial [Desulfobacterales bacterium]
QIPGLETGSYIKLTVSDTGHGMEPDVMERIFDPYYTTKAIGEGTGLGLSVIRGIVQSHNGAITVRSELEKGTTFEVFFPRIDAAEDRAEIKEEKDPPRGTERILFVDDEPAIARTYKSMLTGLGYDVSVLTNSVDALEVFKAHPDRYDLIVTDQTMPHLTGQVLAEEAMAIRPDIPVILCTGHSDSMNEDKARMMGIEAFVMKPVGMAEMAETIREVLDR